MLTTDKGIVITDISKTKKGFNALFSDNEFLFSVDDMILVSHGIVPGETYSVVELEELRKESLENKAVEKCFRYLSDRAHSTRQLYNKLLRYYDEETASSAVKRIEEMGLADDARYRRARAEWLLYSKNKSLVEIDNDLARRGIDRSVRQAAIDEMGVDDQTEQIVRIIRTKYLSRLSQPEKIIAALSRRGFSYREIRERLNAFEDRGTVDPDISINGEMQ